MNQDKENDKIIRDPKSRPSYLLSVNLIDTFKNINKVNSSSFYFLLLFLPSFTSLSILFFLILFILLYKSFLFFFLFYLFNFLFIFYRYIMKKNHDNLNQRILYLIKQMVNINHVVVFLIQVLMMKIMIIY